MNTGVVIKTTGSCHLVKDGNRIVRCKIRGIFREKNIKITNPVAVGDNVQYESDNHDGGIITRIESRKNYIIRRSSNFSKEAHIIASNIDQALLMIAVSMPETPLEFIDRFLLTAEAYHIPVVLIINKTDLITKDKTEKLQSFKQTYTFAGYTCIEMSVNEKKGIDSLIEIMRNKTNLLAGNSGVGKSSLINLICPDMNLKTMDISVSHKTGKHATTYAEMIPLPSGGYIIDTPGLRGFGIVDIEKNEIGLYFNDIFRISQGCSFYNCTHIHEPGCAVRKAVENGILAPSRYQSYVNIFTDQNEKYRTG
ncbi:MAG: ribosome small subunit-dependent GTPase A [Bacteroidales bacterium]|nr:ribosome small subunit-dependent GTPase A [Bacteroidales bacterium]